MTNLNMCCSVPKWTKYLIDKFEKNFFSWKFKCEKSPLVIHQKLHLDMYIQDMNFLCDLLQAKFGLKSQKLVIFHVFFWCMARGDSSYLIFQLQKVDWGPSGRQNWRKTMEFWKILYIHFILEPKDITYVAFSFQIESHAKMTFSNCNKQNIWVWNLLSCSAVRKDLLKNIV